MTRAEAELLFLQNLAVIDRIIFSACARSGFGATEAEDLHGALRLKLIDDDYAVIRAFEGKSAFTTYVTIVVQRFLGDERNRRWGKWTPSAEAVRLGEAAIEVDKLLHRDRRTLEEVCAIMGGRAVPLTRASIEAIAQRLPSRLPRPSVHSIEELAAVRDVATSDGPHVRFLAAERERIGRAGSEALNATIRAMDAADRLLLRMRFEDGMSVALIARATGEEQRRLYYRIERLTSELRRALENAGVDRETARDLLVSGGSTLSVDISGSSDRRPSNGENRGASRGEAAENR